MLPTPQDPSSLRPLRDPPVERHAIALSHSCGYEDYTG
jgi:hypothetical protein